MLFIFSDYEPKRKSSRSHGADEVPSEGEAEAMYVLNKISFKTIVLVKKNLVPRPLHWRMD